MFRYLEIIFRSKFRLLALAVVLPLVFSAVSLYLGRSYDTYESVWVDDPGTFGQGTANALGFDPYATPAQNFARLFSNLVGTQTFNDGIASGLIADGIIHTDAERAALIASLAQLTVSPGRATSGGGGGAASGGASSTDHIISIRYQCKLESICRGVLAQALTVFRSQYSDLKARSAATARAIYEANLKAGEADVALAGAALQKYEASLPKTTNHSTQTDPVLTQLQHNLDSAQKEVDAANAQILAIDTLTQVSKGMANDLAVIDGPRTLPGSFGIRGLSSENVKTDAIAWASCLIAAAAYLILVAFLDRTVRDPDQIKAKLGKSVVTIPEYASPRRERRFPFFGGSRRKRGTSPASA